ncbi:MAG TPA: carbohydrate kinase family protein [Anaerolineales bacterium]|nr:carbohydrate kinase family protein [Anaerolineales bacterium]
MDSPAPLYVGFGMLTPVEILVVDQLPPHNTGAITTDVTEFIFDDAAIVACLLRQWDVPTCMIGSMLGDDERGHTLARKLQEWGVQGTVRFTKDFKTPLEVDVSDKTGARTYFWQRSAQVLDTLKSADLSPIQGAKILYVDWYDGDRILRAMDQAVELNIPVFLNFEHGHADAELLKSYGSRTVICQAVTDAAQLGREAPLEVARKLLHAGVRTALITMAGEGCLAVQGDEMVRVYAPAVTAVDGCGAGATFSAGFIYGYLMGWKLAETVRFATAAASLKVTRAGLQMFSIPEIQALAVTLRAERSVFTDAPMTPSFVSDQEAPSGVTGKPGADLDKDMIR